MVEYKWEYPKKWYNKIPKPPAMTWTGWRKWESEMDQKYPVRYFLQEILPQFFNSKLYILKQRYIWPIVHTLHPKYRYHIVKTGLTPGYYDADIRILHSVFSIFSEFVERNKNGHVNWEANEYHRKIWKELNEINDWWTLVRPHREENFEKENPYPDTGRFDPLAIFDEENENDADVIEFKRISDLHRKAEEKWTEPFGTMSLSQ